MCAIFCVVKIFDGWGGKSHWQTGLGAMAGLAPWIRRWSLTYFEQMKRDSHFFLLFHTGHYNALVLFNWDSSAGKFAYAIEDDCKKTILITTEFL